MAWQSPAGMGLGNGANNGGDGAQSNQPQGTEYTLQGVMRFLQTEWHRHERDRNAWEIERQEMKARIASLEGTGRRADISQTTLKRYIQMLESTLKAERKKAKAATADEEVGGKVKDVYGSKPSKSRPAEIPHNSFLDISETGDNNESNSDNLEAVPDKGGLLNYLQQCNGEFTYLMVAPSNPQPPPEPQPSLSFDEDPRQIAQNQQSLEDIYLPNNILSNQREVAPQQPPRPNPSPNHQQPQHQQQQLPQTKLSLRNADHQAPPMVRSQNEQPQPQTEWRGQQYQAPLPQEQTEEEAVTRVSHTYDSYGRPTSTTVEIPQEREEGTEADGWDFDETASFPEPEVNAAPSRPDTDLFPVAQDLPTSPNRGPGSHRRKGSMSRRRSADKELSIGTASQKLDGTFKIRFGLRGHLDAVRSVIFTGGGSPGEPEVCTAGDECVIKRWIIPARYEGGGAMQSSVATDLDVPSYFTHRGHTGSVMCLTSYSPSANFASGGRAQGDGWVFSGGQDASVRVWERGRVDPKATLDGHTDAVWTVCVLPTTCGHVFGSNSTIYGTPDRLILASGAADGTVKVWSVSAPPQLMSPSSNGSGRRGGGRVRGNSMSAGTGFPSSPQPSVASNSPFHYTLIHTIRRANSDASPTCITPLSPTGDNFVVSYSDAAVLVYDTRTGEEMAAMASLETYDGTSATGVNAVVATSTGLDGSLSHDSVRGLSEEDATVHGATGSSSGIEGTIISGHEDRYIRFYDANSGQCTYNMLAHPASISSLCLSPDGQELVSGGHDASLRFWSLEKRACTQEITSHRLMRGEGVCAVVWSQDGRFVVSGGGDGVVKVFAR